MIGIGVRVGVGVEGPGTGCEGSFRADLVAFLDFRVEILAYWPAFVNLVLNILQNSLETNDLGIKLLPTNLYKVISSKVANSWGTMELRGLNREIL